VEQRVKRALTAGTIAVTAMAASLAGSTPAGASTTEPAPHSGLRFASTEDYVNTVGVAKAKSNGITAQAQVQAVQPFDPVHHWWTVVFSTTDSDGRDIPLRYGYSNAEFGGNGGGWAHACSDHNLCRADLIARTFHEHPESRGGTRFNYSGVVFDNSGRIYEKVLSAQDQSHTGFYETTPDGRPFGLVTAYCQGKTTCPGWINSVP
jgi:hypothetical protein